MLIIGKCSGIGKIMVRKSLEKRCSKVVIWDSNEVGLGKSKDEFSKIDAEVSIFKVDVGF